VKCTPEELAHILANAAFLKPFGLTIESCAPGECRAADGTLLAHHVITYALVPA
jgi:hypothetical protein